MTDDLTSAEAGELIGLSAKRINEYCASGELPARKRSGVWMIRPRDLKKLKRRPVGRPMKRRP